MFAFLLPLLVRSIPEILAWPYPIGYDTLIYADVISRGTYLTLDLADIFKSTSLFFVVATVAGNLLGDAILTVKVLGPVLFAMLCGSLSVYSGRVLGWGPWKALAISIFASTYFVSLRVSWEMYRQMLGFIFLVVGLTGYRLSSLRWKIIVVTLSGFLAVWSHELAGVLYFVIMATHVLARPWHELRFKVLTVLMAAPSFILFLYQLYSPAMGSIYVPYESVSAASWIDSIVFISGFLAYMFLPLLPLVVLGAPSFKEIDMLSWLMTCLIFTYWPMFLSEYSVVSWFRWAILLVYPMIFLSVEGISRVWRFGNEWLWKVNIGRVVALSILVVNLAMSGYYSTSLPEHQIKYFGEWNHYKQFIQTSMLQNSVSLSDTPDVVEAMKCIGKKLVGTNSVLVLHEAMDNWAKLLIHGIDVVSVETTPTSEYVTPRLVQLAVERTANGQGVYTMWWVNGKGWYSIPELPTQFIEIQRFGNIGIFQYSAQ